MKNKRIARAASIIVIILFICAASAINYAGKNRSSSLADIKAQKYVSLADYKNIEMPKGYGDISEEDTGSIMSWDFSSADAYIEVNGRNTVAEDDVILLRAAYYNENSEPESQEFYCELGNEDVFEDDSAFIGKKTGSVLSVNATIYDKQISAEVEIEGIYRYPVPNDEEFILSFYNCSSMDEVEKFIRERAYKEIVFYYMWERITENSEIKKFPDYIENEIDLLKNNPDFDGEAESAYSYYGEFLIAKAILEQESVKIGNKELQGVIDSKCAASEIDSDEIYTYYSYDELYYAAVTDALKNTLVPLIKISE